MRAVELAGPLADPEHVGRAVVPGAGQRVLPGERLLVAEDQRLVARVDVDLVRACGFDSVSMPQARMKPQGPVDLVGDALVALPAGLRRHELLGPGVDPGQVGEAALGERPQQVQRRRRLVVGLHEPSGSGIRAAAVGARVVDDVAAEAGQLVSPTSSVGDERGLANWPAMRPTFTTGTPME